MKVVTNHPVLKKVITRTFLLSRVFIWILKLAACNMNIELMTGNKNAATDALLQNRKDCVEKV